MLALKSFHRLFVKAEAFVQFLNVLGICPYSLEADEFIRRADCPITIAEKSVGFSKRGKDIPIVRVLDLQPFENLNTFPGTS